MKQKRNEMPPVNVHNDAEMVGLKLRKPVATPRDPNIWTKSDLEKKVLASWRSSGLDLSTGVAAPSVATGFTGKLVIYLTKLPSKSHKSTLSFTCDRSDIDSILRECCNRGVEIVKYSWNGRTYKGKEVPPRINRGGRVSA